MNYSTITLILKKNYNEFSSMMDDIFVSFKKEAPEQRKIPLSSFLNVKLACGKPVRLATYSYDMIEEVRNKCRKVVLDESKYLENFLGSHWVTSFSSEHLDMEIKELKSNWFELFGHELKHELQVQKWFDKYTPSDSYLSFSGLKFQQANGFFFNPTYYDLLLGGIV